MFALAVRSYPGWLCRTADLPALEAGVPLDPVDEDLRGHLSHFFHWNMHGGKHGRHILGHVDIINTDDGYIAGNGMTPDSCRARMTPMAVMSLAQK